MTALVLDVPEASAVAMIEACATQIERASTIPDVQKLITQAEAIQLVLQKIRASERVKAKVLILLVDAERQLGRLTKLIPQGIRGAGAIPGQSTKSKVLTGFGIHRSRANIAEKLYDTKPEAIQGAIETGARTVAGVAQVLGIRHRFPHQPSRGDAMRLARTAIGLVDRCRVQGRAPTQAECEALHLALNTLENPDVIPDSKQPASRAGSQSA